MAPEAQTSSGVLPLGLRWGLLSPRLPLYPPITESLLCGRQQMTHTSNAFIRWLVAQCPAARGSGVFTVAVLVSIQRSVQLCIVTRVCPASPLSRALQTRIAAGRRLDCYNAIQYKFIYSAQAHMEIELDATRCLAVYYRRRIYVKFYVPLDTK